MNTSKELSFATPEASKELLLQFCPGQQGCGKAGSKTSTINFALKETGVIWKSLLDTGAKEIATFLLVLTQNLVLETQLHPT